jgi:hypothetical protein
MNMKEMIASIVIAMVVVTMFASTAMAITVDGDGSEWDASWFLASDPVNDTGFENGYDLTGVWQHYENGATEDTLYFMYTTSGIAGDSDGDGHPTTPGGYEDQPGVGLVELYRLAINIDNDPTTGATLPGPSGGQPGFELVLTYKGNAVLAEWWGTASEPAGFVANAAILNTTPFSHEIEFSISNVSQYMNPRNYTLYGYAGTEMDTVDEDHLSEPVEVMEFNFTFRGICCHNMEFDGTGSFGNIKNHTWTFGDGNSTFVNGPPTTVVTNQYPSGGTFDVKLSGYSTNGQYSETTKSVYVDRGPTVGTTWTSKKIDANTPTSVTFDGNPSHADPNGDPLRTITYKWEFNDGYSDQFTPTVTRDVTLAQGATLSATLTVNDSHCEDKVTIYVRTTPPEVPLLTLPGLLALIGMMCIVGAGRIITRGRRS